MATTDLGIRFTEETYASRSQVARSLGTNLIDPFWNAIIAYRKKFSCLLPINDISKFPYQITMCQNVKGKFLELEDQLSRYKDAFSKLNDGSYEKNILLFNAIKQDLLGIAKANKIFVNDIALKDIISHKSKDLTYEKIINYYKASEFINSQSINKLDLDLIAGIYSYMTGEGELSSFYRDEEINSFSQKVIINRVYEGAPTRQIEPMMNSLIAFANNSTYSISLRAAVCFYMINYIKPFASFNDEMSILIVKAVLSMSEAKSICAYIPLGTLLSENQLELANNSKETQRTRDITFIVIASLKSIGESIQFILDKNAVLNVSEAQKSYLMGEDKEQIKEEFGVLNQQEEVPEIVTPKKETKPKPVTQKVQIVEKQIVEPEKELSEKELRKAMNDMLESDPMIRESQAHFYVKHCQKGRYYTIQQFKKCEGCVYETARTSMDNLAKQGYYKREQVKNKFVYTPIIK